MAEQRGFVTDDGLERRKWVLQLFAGAFQFAEGGIGAAVGAFTLQAAQPAPGIAKGLAAALQIALHRLQLGAAGALFGRRCIEAVEMPAFGRAEVGHRRRFGQERPFTGRQRLEVILEASGLRPGALGVDVGQQAADAVAHATLIVDDGAEPSLQRVAAVDAVRQAFDALQHQFEIHPGGVVLLGCQPGGVVEPSRTGAQGRKRRGRFRVRRGVGLPGEGEAQVEGGPVAQRGIGAGGVPRRQKTGRGVLEGTGLQAAERMVVLGARAGIGWRGRRLGGGVLGVSGGGWRARRRRL